MSGHRSSGRGPEVRRVGPDRVNATNITSVRIKGSVLLVDWADSVVITEVPDGDGFIVTLCLNNAYRGSTPGTLDDVLLDGERVPADWEYESGTQAHGSGSVGLGGPGFPRHAIPVEPDIMEFSTLRAEPVDVFRLPERYTDRYVVDASIGDVIDAGAAAIDGVPNVGDINAIKTHRVDRVYINLAAQGITELGVLYELIDAKTTRGAPS